MRSASICRRARSRRCRRQEPQRTVVAGADGDLADVEEDGLVEHQPVAPAVGRHQADAAPRRIGRAARQAAAVGKASRWRCRRGGCRRACEDVGHARALQPGEPDDLAGPGRERHWSSWPPPDLDHDAAFGDAGPRRQRRREQRLALLADHPLDDLGNGELGGRPCQHVAAVAGDGDAIGDREDLLQPVRHVEHGDAARAQSAAARRTAARSRAR